MAKFSNILQQNCKQKYNLKLVKFLLLSVFFSICNVHSEVINIGRFGGDNAKAQSKIWDQAWSKDFGDKIRAHDFTGNIAQLNGFDLVEVSGTTLTRGCDLGLFERISLTDFDLNAKSLIPNAINSCGVGMFVFSNVLAYNQNHLKTAPTSWRDFWDVKKFPGKRALRKRALFNLEFALLADGVAHEDIYKILATKEGQDRAFAKLDELKPHLVWWEKAEDALTKLKNGDVVMSSMYNGRIKENHQKQGINFVWQDGIYDIDFWAIRKNAPNQDLIKDFIKFTLQPENQANFAQEINYGAVNNRANTLIAPEIAAKLPTSANNLNVQLAPNNYFWTDNAAALEERFNNWLNL